MLQKIVNGIAIASGVVSLAVVGTVGYVYVRKDAIIENIKGKVMESVMPDLGGGIGGIVPDFTKQAAPVQPTAPMPEGVGLGIPNSSGTDKTNWYSKCNHSPSCTKGLVILEYLLFLIIIHQSLFN